MIGIEIKGLSNLDNYVNKFNKNKMASFKKVGVIAVRDILLHFRNSQGQNGIWKPLSSRSGKPLQKTGHLQESISEAIHSDNSIEVGTNLLYAKIQNFGGTILPKNKKYLSFKIGNNYIKCKKAVIPQREFMWISVDADNKIIDMLTGNWEKL